MEEFKKNRIDKTFLDTLNDNSIVSKPKQTGKLIKNPLLVSSQSQNKIQLTNKTAASTSKLNSKTAKLQFAKTQLIRLATRTSKLALEQTKIIADRLKMSGFEKVEIVEIKSSGDLNQDKNISEIGGKGVFVKELEEALVQKKAEIAVHSLKDLPSRLDRKFTIAAFCERSKSPGDAFVSKKYNSLEELISSKADHKIGTSSPRRIALLNEYYKGANVVPCRGNIDTRIKKLEEGEFDALILATCGLERIGLKDEIKQQLDPLTFIPAVGQGGIALECLSHNKLLAEVFEEVFNHMPSAQAAKVERDIAAALGLTCDSRCGIHASFIEAKDSAGLKSTRILVKAFVADEKGTFITSETIGLDPKTLVSQICSDLRSKGAGSLINK